MYLMWAESKRFSTEITDREDGGAAGIQEATIHIKGEYAYGYLRGETGVHRLVRISPFDSNSRRHTSFASIDVLPEVDDTIDIVLRDEDLKRDVFRSGGPGGQHQNKTESGVRYTHLPTGVAAESRSERSQHKNDTNALATLKAKLIRLEEEKREAEFAKKYDEKGEVSFGNQIRSYVLQPYQIVKDLRTDYEVGNPRAVLDGNIDGFIEAYLRMKLAKGGMDLAKKSMTLATTRQPIFTGKKPTDRADMCGPGLRVGVRADGRCLDSRPCSAWRRRARARSSRRKRSRSRPPRPGRQPGVSRHSAPSEWRLGSGLCLLLTGTLFKHHFSAAISLGIDPDRPDAPDARR